MQSASRTIDRGTGQTAIARIGGRFEPLALALPPQPLTSFVGREHEIAAVAATIGDVSVRLLTLTGPAGVGKTRLALRVLDEVAPRFSDGAAFVSLADVTDPALVSGVIAQSLGTRDSSELAPVDRLRIALGGKQFLLALDNVEHVAEAGPELARLLGSCPGLKMLVTSRGPLRITGEHEFAVPTLDPPEPGATSPGDLGDNPAVALFVQRARSVRPVFALNEENAEAVGEICRRLDGLPLAIELAAARSKLLAPAVLRSRLERGLELLTGGPRDQPQRLQTLRGAIAWSYDLLDPSERAFFSRLAVFAGGFTQEAAEVVTAAEDSRHDHTPIFDLIASLVDNSLLVQEDGADGNPRFRMLETIRAFGLEVLTAHEEAEAVRATHAAWFLALAERAEPDVGPRHKYWLEVLECEHPNLRAALGWFIERGDASGAVRLAGALWPFWFFHNHFREGVSWLERSLALPGDDAHGARGSALFGAGILAWARGDLERARAWHEEGLAKALKRGDRSGEGRARYGIGEVARLQGRDDEAGTFLREALALFRQEDDRSWATTTLNSLGSLAVKQGDLERGQTFAQDGLALSRQTGDDWSAGEALAILALVAQGSGDVPQAADLWGQSLAVFTALRDRWLTARVVSGIASAAVVAGEMTVATRLFGASEALQESIGGTSALRAGSSYGPQLARARSTLGDDAYEAAWRAGHGMSPEAAIAEAAEVAARLRDGASPPNEIAARSGEENGIPFGLSPREIEVLRLLVAGQTDREIGATLFISPRTAQGHVARIFAKLGVNTRTAAVALALQSGVLGERGEDG